MLPPFQPSLRCLLLVAGLLAVAPSARAGAAESARSLEDLKKLSLEELLSVQVTTVSRRAESVSGAAAAVEAITPQQIERTGSPTVADALRLAAGVQVSQFGGQSFAVSARGFASLAANKMQVMQDGRSLYSPLYSGIFWDAYGTVLEDLERIEVVRGPGATLWGANAVNGVINIITKDARDTQGSLVSLGLGTDERTFGTVRYGGAAGDTTHFRVYARYDQRARQALANGGEANNATRELQGGFRLDGRPGPGRHFTLQGDYFHNRSPAVAGQRPENSSAFLLGRWTQQMPNDAEWQVQAYSDRFERDVPRQFGETRNTFDFDLQYNTRVAERHKIVAGVNYRVSSDDTTPGGTVQFSPAGKTIQLASAFVQAQLMLVPERLVLIAGSKFEWNSLAELEPQPSVRLAWTPTENQTIWAAASRAVRMPSRIDEDLRFIPVPSTGVAFIRGNPDFESETLRAYEIGYRVQPTEQFFFDLAAFQNEYRGLRSLEPALPTGIPLVQFNRLDAEITGFEVAVKYQPASWLRFSGNYTQQRKRLQPQVGSNDPNRGSLEGNDAARHFSLWTSLDLPRDVSLDLVLRHMGDLPQPAVPDYLELDLRLAWEPTDQLEVALVGRNLLDPQHREFGPATPTAVEIKRNFHAKLTWRF